VRDADETDQNGELFAHLNDQSVSRGISGHPRMPFSGIHGLQEGPGFPLRSAAGMTLFEVLTLSRPWTEGFSQKHPRDIYIGLLLETGKKKQGSRVHKRKESRHDDL
jgi:hypothetical protein